MSKKLIIVESPAKAKTINKYLGDQFVVTSSYGHIRDLPSSGLAIDIANNYEPQYEVSDDKEKVIRELKKLAKDSQEVYLATDEDREGEAIAWHLCSVLKLDPATAKRITYTEITEKAVKNAVANPRTLNLNLVNAQQARRVLDRLVGYELSPVLWRKVKPSLSAGRVQSVAVRLIVDREREINNFNSVSNFKIIGYFIVKDKAGKTVTLKAESTAKYPKAENAEKYLSTLVGATFNVKNIEKKPSKRTPSAPFTTSTLQQEASRKLGFSVTKTMVVAQRLYEAGFITYMRTDSTSLSDLAIANIATEVKSKYGANYHKSRQYATKNASAQEAHEAIRPSDIAVQNPDVERDEARLYDLIWKRTIASQMSDAELEKTIISIENNKNDDVLQATGEMVIFDGFLKVYNESSDDDDENEAEDGKEKLLPPLKVSDILPLKEMIATERFSKAAPRYTEAALVKRLEELGIGRPSTYAPTIATVQKRNYVVKESREGVERKYAVIKLADDIISKTTQTEITGAEKNKLFPTDIGAVVTDFLVENFKDILDFGFTAEVEKQFDEIAEGKIEWHKMIDGFYQPFHNTIEITTKESKRVTGERALGEEPGTGEPVIARMGKFGPMIQIGSSADETKKPKYARLRAGQSIETITLEQAMELFKLPRTLGEFEGKEVKVSVGRFGPYVQHNSKFVSLKKEQDPFEISLEEAIELIEAKRESDANKQILIFEDAGIEVLNGRWGPYIKKGKDNYKIPKDKNAALLTLDDCLALIQAQVDAPKKKGKPFKKK